MENADRNGAVANGGWGKKKDNKRKGRREEGDDGEMRVGIDGGEVGVFNNKGLRQSLG